VRLSACVEMLFVDEAASVPERIHLAARAGVPAVEFWTWRDKEIAAVEEALQETGLELASFLTEPRGRLVDPTTHDAFIDGLGESIEVARRLGTGTLIVLSGDEIADQPRWRQHDAVAEALRRAAPVAEAHGVTLVLEPLNTEHDHPGYYLHSTTEGFDIVHAVRSDRVKLLYDVYHSVMMAEEPETVLEGRIDLVGHVHVADAPGRHEPGTGDVDWERHFRLLQRLDYRGFIGLEYRPRRASHATIETVRRTMAAAAGPTADPR
jgi:hydroxypyruvate isomerase